MKKGIITALLFVLCSYALKAQQQYAFRVSFTDKNATTHTLNNPIAYLTQRAIDRRNAQGIAVDSTDLPVPASYIQGVLSACSGVLHTKSRWLNHIVVLVSSPSNMSTVQTLPYVSNIQEVGRFASVLHNIVSGSSNTGNTEEEAQEGFVPLAKSSGSAAYYGTGAWPQISMVNGDYLHDQGYKGEGMLIAVLDDGFVSVPTHPGFDSLHLENRILETHNFVLDTSYIYNVSSNHGGAVLSTMAANEPGTYVGTAPKAAYVLYITENLNSETPTEMHHVLSAAERADSIGADIITISSGYNTFENPYPDLSFSDLNGSSTIAARAANIATKKGILFVATAGNDGGAGLLTPGDADSALTVGAVLADSSAWSSSGHGPNSSGRIKPDVVTKGAPAYVANLSGTYSSANGTSFSTPQIAGWAACLWQASPGATPRKLRAAIDSSAHVHTAPEIQRGYGVPNFMLAAQLLNVPILPKDMSGWITAGPNPFAENFNLFTNLPISDDVSYRITDVSGKLILEDSRKIDSGIHSTNISLPANLPGGLYFLYVRSAQKDAVLKLVKNN